MLLYAYLCVAGLFFLAVLLLLATALVQEARRGLRTGLRAGRASAPEVGTPEGSSPLSALSLSPLDSTGPVAPGVPASTARSARRAEAARLRAALEETRHAYLALAEHTGSAAERRALRAELRALRDRLRALGVDLRRAA